MGECAYTTVMEWLPIDTSSLLVRPLYGMRSGRSKENRTESSLFRKDRRVTSLETSRRRVPCDGLCISYNTSASTSINATSLPVIPPPSETPQATHPVSVEHVTSMVSVLWCVSAAHQKEYALSDDVHMDGLNVPTTGRGREEGEREPMGRLKSAAVRRRGRERKRKRKRKTERDFMSLEQKECHVTLQENINYLKKEILFFFRNISESSLSKFIIFSF
jgi:hypothetical protein